MVVTQIQEDLFTAPQGSILAHACNCQGVWGSGIAVIFKQRFPEAFEQYAAYCDRPTKGDLLGTTLLIDAGDYDIACCFTSEHYGARRDGEDKILDSTRRAFEDLVGQLKQGGSHPPPVAACKLNAGRFGVKWERTKAIMTEVFGAAGIDVTVYDR